MNIEEAARNFETQKNKERNRAYYQANKEKINERSRKWREQNKERHNEYIKRWREANREKVNAYQRERYEANAGGYRDKMLAYSREQAARRKAERMASND